MSEGRRSTDGKDKSLEVQFGGNHYKGFVIEPAEYLGKNSISFLEGSVVKYISRHQLKAKEEDVKKAVHFCAMILSMTYGIKMNYSFEDGKACSQKESVVKQAVFPLLNTIPDEDKEPISPLCDQLIAHYKAGRQEGLVEAAALAKQEKAGLLGDAILALVVKPVQTIPKLGETSEQIADRARSGNMETSSSPQRT